jgi:hypothetical protein
MQNTSKLIGVINFLAAIFFLSIIPSTQAFASPADQYVTSVTIRNLSEFSDYYNGNIIFGYKGGTPNPVCSDGFWLSSSETSFKNQYAMILMANATQAPVNLYGDSAQLWSGSNGKYCKLSLIQFY